MAGVTGNLNVLPSDTISLYLNPNGQGIWQHFIIRNHYEKDGHIYQMGIASPAGFKKKSVAFVQLAAPTLLWVCDWTISRDGDAPIVPSPTPQVSDWILLDDWWDTDPIGVAGIDGITPYYQISGTYIYGHPNPAPNTNANIVFPLVPWIDPSIITSDLRIIPNSLLKTGFSDIQTNNEIQKAVPRPGAATSSTSANGASGKGIVH